MEILKFPAIPAVHQLTIKEIFDKLTLREKLYAHHLSQAAWQGSRIILRQTSPEGTGILNFILELHKACSGRWNTLVEQCDVGVDELQTLLEFSGLFLSNMGNYFGEGDRKVVPQISENALRKMASISRDATTALEKIIEPLLAIPPRSLGFPDGESQSNYYPGQEIMTKEDIAAVTKVLEKHSVEPENTRIRKIIAGKQSTFEVLQASVETDARVEILDGKELETKVCIKRGDHAMEMAKICAALSEASKFAASDKQTDLIAHYKESFKTGSLKAYRKSQKVWVTDVSPRVENILGFVEPYRDPYGVRAEWEGVVCITDPDETSKLKSLVDGSTKFIRMLPWAVTGENDGKGPFEASLFQAPDFSIVHCTWLMKLSRENFLTESALAFCTSFVWEAVNLPNYSDIRETCGLKNIVFANRMSVNKNPSRPCHYVHPREVQGFRDCNHIVRFIVTAIHELLGHGTGKLLTETAKGTYNFDRYKLPTNPLTGRAIETWYQLGQTWTSVFGKLATSVEECRAMLVSYFLADNKEILSTFGYDDKSRVSADDLVYYTYLHVGVEGVQALHTFNAQTQTWGQPHARANFAILKYLLLDGDGVMTVKHDAAAQVKVIHVHVDRSKITSRGKPSLGRMLCRLHVWRCIADIKSCKAFYEPLSVVDGKYEAWRLIVASKPEPRWKFVQPNTVLNESGGVDLKVYENSNVGIIESFVDRGL